MGHTTGFTPAETAALEKFREVTSDVLEPHHEDYHLIQWLRARNLDVSKAEKMFRQSLEWRKQWQPDNLLDNWDRPEVLQKFYPMSFLDGYAKDESPIVMCLLGRADNRGFFQCVSSDDFLRYILLKLEYGRREMEKQTRKLGRPVTQQIAIFDVEGLSFQQIFYKPVMDLIIKAVQMFESNYPESMKAVYVINAPRLFSLVYSVVRPFMHENTQKKVRIFTSDSSKWIPALLEVIPEDVLPKHWGGTKTDADGNPFCESVVVMGGRVPKSYYRSAKLQEEESQDGKHLTEATVNCGDQLCLDFEVTEPGSQLRYEFRTRDCDIGFGIRYNDVENSETEDMIAVERVESHLGGEDGEFTCQKPGLYTVVFDNTYSMMRCKHLLYNIDLISPIK